MYEQYDQKLDFAPDKEKDWNKLSDCKCPLCGLDLLTEMYHKTCTCGFKIGIDKFDKFITEQQNLRLSAKERKNLQEGRSIRFKETKTFKGERPGKLDLGF